MGRGAQEPWRYVGNLMLIYYRFITLLGTAPEPNFISNIFYLTVAMSHYGYLRTIQTFNDLSKHIEDIQRHHDMLNGDGSWMTVHGFMVILPKIF